MSDTWKKQLESELQSRFDEMVQMRRHLHAYPEVSGAEHKTSLYLYQRLGEEGLDVRLGVDGCGVVADGCTNDQSDAPCFALRADIDALHIQDQKTTSYRSQREGVMHACGHDAHSTMVFAAVSAIQRMRRDSKLPCPVPIRAIFQPSEENCRGARQMIELGVMKNVGVVLGLHVDPTRQTGVIGLRNGVFTANCDEMQIIIHGQGGHGARPHQSRDPINAAAQLINALYLHIPLATDSQDVVVATIGKISGGDNSNVIPEMVTLQGTVRTLDGQVRMKTMEHIRRIADGIAQTTRTDIEVSFGLWAPSINNDSRLVDLLHTTVNSVLGPDATQHIDRPSMGSEDFAFYLKESPGAMFRIGCASERVGNSGLHTSTFDVDDHTLLCGANILAQTAVSWCVARHNGSASTI